MRAIRRAADSDDPITKFCAYWGSGVYVRDVMSDVKANESNVTSKNQQLNGQI